MTASAMGLVLSGRRAPRGHDIGRPLSLCQSYGRSRSFLFLVIYFISPGCPLLVSRGPKEFV